MGGFALLDHTADIGISACGETLEDALSWLAIGMFSLIIDPDAVAASHSRVVSVVSRNREALAVDWLNELLYQYEATGFLMKDCQVSLGKGDRDQGSAEQGNGEQDNARLEALCHGDQVDLARHQILTVVKAATYHRLSVSQGRMWQVSVILDV